jgi:hypothetical protein
MIMTENGTSDSSIDAATAALKGMLGLGPSTAVVVPSTAGSVTVDEQETAAPQLPSNASTPPQQQQQQQRQRQTAEKKKNNSSNKKKKNTKGSNAATEPQSANKNNKLSNPATVSTGKKNKQQPPPQQQQKKKEPENFAWSAFQSSPDASKLPIPAFHSPTAAETKKFNVSLSSDNSDKLLPVALNMSDEGGLKEEAIPVIEPEETEAPLSKTGINLAASLTEQPHLNSMQSAPQQQSQSSPMFHTYSGPSHYNSINAQSLPHMYQPQHPSQYHQPPSNANIASLHHLSSNMHHHPPPPPAPPGYVTILVEVPAVLMPGRQMVVSSPATSGYPVQVVVPEGVPAGMILPVHVPMGPPRPMHMMPPQPHPQLQQPPQQHYPPHHQPPPHPHNRINNYGH